MASDLARQAISRLIASIGIDHYVRVSWLKRGIINDYRNRKRLQAWKEKMKNVA